MNETLYLLEMTAPGDLKPARAVAGQIRLKEVGPAEASSVGSIYRRIGAPLGWVGRMGWTDSQWRDELSGEGVHAWVVLVDDDVAGLVELETEPNGDVGIVILGLVPEFIGRGYGGALLTIATERAWQLTGADAVATKRVWVQTSSDDHPHALRNYAARGFRTFRVEDRGRSIPR